MIETIPKENGGGSSNFRYFSAPHSPYLLNVSAESMTHRDLPTVKSRVLMDIWGVLVSNFKDIDLKPSSVSISVLTDLYKGWLI